MSCKNMLKERVVLVLLFFTILCVMSAGSANNNLVNATTSGGGGEGGGGEGGGGGGDAVGVLPPPSPSQRTMQLAGINGSNNAGLNAEAAAGIRAATGDAAGATAAMGGGTTGAAGVLSARTLGAGIRFLPFDFISLPSTRRPGERWLMTSLGSWSWPWLIPTRPGSLEATALGISTTADSEIALFGTNCAPTPVASRPPLDASRRYFLRFPMAFAPFSSVRPSMESDPRIKK